MEGNATNWGGSRLVPRLAEKLRQGQRYSHSQSYLEELVEQEGKPIGQHLLGHRLSSVTRHRGNQQRKTKTEAASQTPGLGKQRQKSAWVLLHMAFRPNLEILQSI